jgi:hypothetical protein
LKKSSKRGGQSAPHFQAGYHNSRLGDGTTQAQVMLGNSYKKRSTVCFIPSLGNPSVRWIQAYINLMKPMNQKFTQIFLVNQEVGKAYEQMVDILRAPQNAELRKWQYVLTIEEDNIPPPDALLKIYDDLENSKLDAVGAIYWTKGENGKPMCYGKAKDEHGIPIVPRDFIPWCPPDNTVVECNGLGMGFTLYKMKMFLDERWKRPIFQTEQSYTPGVGIRAYTQDLKMFEEAAKLGYRFGCTTKVKVGHYSQADDMIW